MDVTDTNNELPRIRDHGVGRTPPCCVCNANICAGTWLPSLVGGETNKSTPRALGI